MFGDYNAKNAAWFDTRPTDDSGCLSRGAALQAWSRRAHTCERGPRLPTRHRAGDIPSKLDLIWTRRDSPNFSIGDYAPLAHSDHSSLHCRFRLIKPPVQLSHPRPDYRHMNADLIADLLRTQSPPQNPSDLDSLITTCLARIPRITRHPNRKLPADLLASRRLVHHLQKKRWGSDQYKIAQEAYRKELAQYINSDIEESLDAAHDPEFFKFTRRHRVNRPVPSLKFHGQCYSGHARIAKCLADHHGAGAPIPTSPISHPDIPPVTPLEVTDALSHAPRQSSNGPDCVSGSLLQIIHQVFPAALGHVFTGVLRSGLHPQSWKLACVVPIPKAKKPTYTHPKSWRSIHLLSVISKTLERIVLRRLQDSDTPGHPLQPMGPSQFGSRMRRGTSDAMQCLLRWQENARSLGHHTSLISADIEGGFDKVDPRKLRDSDLNPLYIPWIEDWAANRNLQFRHNNCLDPTIYTCNRGIPQGSPLSPFLFGAYVKKLTDPRLVTHPDHSRLVISYVDDVLICISAQDMTTLEALAKSTWTALTSEALSVGMSFADNKTKTLHDTRTTWGIGTTVQKLRFLGYWLTTPPPPLRLAPPTFEYHCEHWFTKANVAFNTLRALTLRSDKGLRSTPILRILDSCVRSILLYGIEFWGSDNSIAQKADAFMYGAIRNLFDLSIATPHRAISSEFSIMPTAVRFHHITRRIAARHLTHRPLDWLNGHLAEGSLLRSFCYLWILL